MNEGKQLYVHPIIKEATQRCHRNVERLMDDKDHCEDCLLLDFCVEAWDTALKAAGEAEDRV